MIIFINRNLPIEYLVVQVGLTLVGFLLIIIYFEKIILAVTYIKRWFR